MNERREDPRIVVSFPVECSVLPQQNYFYTVSKDLSSGGVKILSNSFLTKGNYLKIHINLIDKVVKLKAEVIWCNKKRISDKYAAGLRFTEITRENKWAISQFVNQIYNS